MHMRTEVCRVHLQQSGAFYTKYNQNVNIAMSAKAKAFSCGVQSC